MRKVLALIAAFSLVVAPVVYGAADENFIGPTITKNKINVRGDIRAGDDLIVVDDASIGDDLAVGGDLDITGDVIFDGNMDINAGLDVDTPTTNLIGIQFTTVTDAAAGEIGITAGQDVDIEAVGDDVLIDAADDIALTAVGGLSVDSAGIDIGLTGIITNAEWQGTIVDVTRGGTGIADPTDHAVLVGSGAAAMDAVGVGADNEVLCGATSADPTFRALADVDVPEDLTIAGGTVNDSIIGGSTPAAITGTTITGATFTDQSMSVTAGVFSGIVDLGVVATAAINGGTIDSTTIGVATPDTGAFTTLAASDTVTITQTTEGPGYSNDIATTWTAGTDMAGGGSNGIYAVSNPVEDVQNAYALRGRMDLRTASEEVAVNQLHTVDALINLNETYYYYVDDNMSVIGGAVHGNAAGGIGGQGTGSLGGATLNVVFGMWGPTATADVDVETNFIKMISHAATTVDYGLNIESSSDMDAGILLNSHSSNSPATMDVGIEMISAAGKMIYGIDMSAAGITGADWKMQEGETIDNITDGIINVVGDGLQVRGALNYAGTSASTGPDTYVLNATPDLVVTSPLVGQVVTWSADTTGTGASTISVDGVSDTLEDREGNATASGDITTGMPTMMIFGSDGNWHLVGI